ncbi:MAG: hypothetical protein IPL32_16590 [Chloracidobacterium sp.]|nr:hypothetical protein [Chloracidobacterium sp.]
MIYKQVAIGLTLFLLFSAVNAQKAEVNVSLNEAFFDALLDSTFQHFDPPEFPIVVEKSSKCNESVRILREMDGVRTAVRFREGKIFVPLAFSGNYAPPFVGCVGFAGWAETNIDLEFDEAGQRLVGRVRVLNVNLNGTGGVGGTMIAKLLQGSIDKKLNPIEIIRLDKLSFGVPVQNGGNLRMKAASVRPEIGSGMLNIRVMYEFLKG